MNNIFLIGDSTCQTNDESTFPQVGWGQFFEEYLKNPAKVHNFAKNGRSSKSFFEEHRFDSVIENFTDGDFLFIQFGHNDEKEDKERKTEPFGTYKDYLSKYIDFAKSKNGTPVLLSSIYRRKFVGDKLENNNHGKFPEAMKELAIEKGVIFIDLCSLTKDKIENEGPERSKEYFMNFKSGEYPNYPEGKEDNTHLREKGARMVLELLTNEMRKYPELNKLLK